MTKTFVWSSRRIATWFLRKGNLAASRLLDHRRGDPKPGGRSRLCRRTHLSQNSESDPVELQGSHDARTRGYGERSTSMARPMRFFASMRPMSAQTIQKTALADLSRVALEVPPTVDVGAPVKVFLKKNVDNQAQVVELEGLGDACAQVLMPRGGRDIYKRALFMSKFVRELLAKLEELEEDDLLPDYRQNWRDCIENAVQLRKAMLRDGLVLPGEGIFKLVTSVGNPRRKGWLEIVIDVSDDALINLQGTDPLGQEDEP